MRRLVSLSGLLIASALLGVPSASAEGIPSPADTLDTSGHTHLKVFGTLYGSYLGVTVPLAAEANDIMFYSLGLMTGPGGGLMAASNFAETHGFSSGDAIALSSLTWFGAMQGHLWVASSDPLTGANVAASGVLGSLCGFAVGASLTGAHDFTEGQAASLGAGNWWGSALGYLGAQANEAATGPDEARGAAIGGATGLALGALVGRRATHNDVQYLHIGGVLGWLYASGMVVLNEPDQQGSCITQMVGIGTGMTAGLLASKYRPWRPRSGLHLDHSGRMRAQVFAAAYGGYLATVIPLANDVDWWTEDTKRTYALAYMHAPPALLLGTTFFTRNVSVSKADAMTVSGLTWFGAVQGALWSAARKDAETPGVAATSAIGSGVGLALSAVVARRDLTEAQAAMLGAGNWWGTTLGFFFGSMALGEDVEGGEIAVTSAMGGAVGMLAGSQIGRHMSLARVRTMHVGGLTGLLFGTGALLGGNNIGFRGAMGIMGFSTLAGLAMGGGLGSERSAERASLDVEPFLARGPGLSGEPHTVVGVTLRR